jgi:nitroreductase
MLKKIFFTFLLVSFAVYLSAEELSLIKLPPPQIDSGKSLSQALKDRKSTRSFGNKRLPVQVLADILWSACGVKRPDQGKLTAPSPLNWQGIDVYVATTEGLYLYKPEQHLLQQILNQDIRALTGKQSYAAEAPVNLLYVADYSRIGNTSAEDEIFYVAASTDFISQNVYLYCAAEGLATFVPAAIDKKGLAKTMELHAEQKIILAQSIGYPK